LYSGADCSELRCPGNCSGRGTCIKGMCFCQDSYLGLDCSTPPCQNCSGHGKCNEKQECVCESGWIGSICQTKTCLGYPQSECSKHGMCINGECQCSPGFFNKDCSGSCPSAFGQNSGVVCSNHGKCFENRCACDPSWTGTDCNSRTCPSQCNGRGTCNNGTCICNPPYIGDDCETEPSDSENSSGCDCGMNCTVLCLRHCSGIHDKYGLSQGHQCYSDCNHYCLIGCATRGEPTLESFVPTINAEDYGTMVKADYTVTAEDLKPPLDTIEKRSIGNNLIQDSATITDDDLPTME